MTARPGDAAEAGLHIARALAAAQIPYALGGALALGAHGVPRGTLDVDVNVFVGVEQVPRVVSCLNDLGIQVVEQQAQKQAEADGMIVAQWIDIRIDVFVPSIPFSDEAGRTRVHLKPADGTTIDFLSAESLCVFKLLFHRAKDVVDLERLLVVQGNKLDRSYVRRWIVDMMGQEDERVETWDNLCARFQGEQ